MKLTLIVASFFMTLAQAKTPAHAVPATLKYTPTQIFEFVLSAKNKKLNTTILFPKIFFKSKTPLKQFQDAVEPQWHMRPTEFTNAYIVLNNEIYIMDDADYYIKAGRCMDDSLAHELTHYVQDKYQHFDLNDESLEWDAVDVQTQFREAFCK